MFGNKEEHQSEEIKDEEFEFYDMSDFEKRVFKRLDVLEMKLDNISEDIEDNQHRLKNIQFQFTRQLILRVLKLAIIGGIIYYVYINFLSPLIFGVSEKYYDAQLQLEKLNQINNANGGVLESAKGLLPNLDTVLDDLRPGSATSTVENQN